LCGHVVAPLYVPYPGRARMPRRQSDHRSLRYAGVNSLLTFVASGLCQVAPLCHLSTRACVTGVTSPTHNRPSPTIRRPPRPLPRVHAQPPPELRSPPLTPPR
jgi:hypothetical protein